MINVPVDVIGWSLCSLESNSKTISSACVHVIKTHSSFLGSSSFGLALKLNFGRAAKTQKSVHNLCLWRLKDRQGKHEKFSPIRVCNTRTLYLPPAIAEKPPGFSERMCF